MMEEPGWRGGNVISQKPALGPEAIRRRSLEILINESADVFKLEDKSVKISVLLVASTRLSAVVKLSPVTSVSCSQTSLIYSGSAFRPVPTAVAPMFMVCSSSQLRRM